MGKQLCWCQSGLPYEECHEAFDKKCAEYKKQGRMIPPHKMIKNERQIKGIRLAAQVNNGLLDEIEKNIHAGMSTNEIDRICREYLKKNHAKSADLGYMGYPKSICTSVNDVICHGIPSDDVILKEGDIINVDATTQFRGFFADASRMFCIGTISDEAKELVDVTKECLQACVDQLKPWENTLGDAGKIISRIAHLHGFSVVEEYCGHGVGLSMHEDPYILHYESKGPSYTIVPGMVFTIEPMINQGKKGIRISRDGWTASTVDGKLSAQWEHTLLVTETGLEVLSK